MPANIRTSRLPEDTKLYEFEYTYIIREKIKIEMFIKSSIQVAIYCYMRYASVKASERVEVFCENGQKNIDKYFGMLAIQKSTIFWVLWARFSTIVFTISSEMPKIWTIVLLLNLMA